MYHLVNPILHIVMHAVYKKNILVVNNRKLHKKKYLPVVFELIRREVCTIVTRIE